MSSTDLSQLLLATEATESKPLHLRLKANGSAGSLQSIGKQRWSRMAPGNVTQDMAGLGVKQPHAWQTSWGSLTSVDDAEEWTPETHGLDKMPLSGVIVSMCADLIPTGLCMLSGCMASSRIGFLPASLLAIAFSGISSYTLGMVAQIAETLEVREPCLRLTFEGVWKILIGRASWLPSLAVLATCFANCVAYSLFLTDFFMAALPVVGGNLWFIFGDTLQKASRTHVLLTVSVPLLPLCLCRDLPTLAQPAAGTIPVFMYIVGFMAIRALDGSYHQGGMYYNSNPDPLTPDETDNLSFRMGTAPMLFVNALTIAYFAHYNGMKYYRELEQHDVKTFNMGARSTMAIAAFVYIVTMWLSRYTFGENTSGMILSNCDQNDDLATVARIGMGFSILCSYPFMFSGVREAAVATLTEVFPENEEMFKKVQFLRFLTLTVLLTITVTATHFKDGLFVMGLAGSVFGTIIVYVLPSLLYIQAHKDSQQFQMSVILSKMFLVFGTMLGIFGCYSVLSH